MTGLATHPRVRGEHSEEMAKGRAEVGSSPLVRGTREWMDTQMAVQRFIPARVGNTLNKLKPPSINQPEVDLCASRANEV